MTFLISVGASVVAPFIVDGLKRISSAIASAATYPAEARPITEREAKFWAEVMVGARFEGLRPDELKATGLKLDESNGTAAVELQAADGSAYRVRLELVDGLVVLGEVQEINPEQST
ncbi:MAG: hypothetical protein ACJ74F_32160 [Mycobacterium sp.]|uniref:hypothetical protein n=1 Tax=Mycobacterium sp. TaxID=1785 RepID=UPI00389B2C2A